MPNPANVNFLLTDKSQVVSPALLGITFVEGVTMRGPINDPKDVITTWNRFRQLYGDLIAGDYFPLLCKRMLDQGAAIRVNRITDGTATLAAQATSKYVSFSADFDTSDTAIVTYNSVAQATLTFGAGGLTTHALFMAALAAQIAAQPEVQSCIHFDGASAADSKLLITAKPGKVLPTISIACTGGPTATFTDKTKVISKTGATWFSIKPKHKGADYNNLLFTISAPTNGQAGYVNITITHQNDKTVREFYQDQYIAVQTGETAGYLTDIISKSDYVTIEYFTPQAETGLFYPLYGTYTVTGGTDGGTPVLADYVGDSADGTGFYAFDAYEDSYSLAVLSKSEADLEGLSSAGDSYASNRKDIKYFAAIDNSNTTATNIMGERDATLIDSKFTIFIGGGLQVYDDLSEAWVNSLPLADVLANESKIIKMGVPWLSFAGLNRGTMKNTLGPVNNFGTNAKYADLQLIVNDQVNMVVARSGQVLLWDDYTAQKVFSQLSFASVVNLVLYIQKSLKPLLERYLGEPCDIPLFKEISLVVMPFFTNIINNRGIVDYRWLGDQDATTPDDFQINNPADVDLGKYKVLLKIKPIPPLKEFTVEVYINPAGVSFE